MIPISERIKKYTDWRLRQPVERPMIGLLWEPDIPPLPTMLEEIGIGNEVVPEQINPEMFLPYIDNWYEADLRLVEDSIQPFTPAFGIPWMEAIVGCKVIAHPGSLWAEPALESYRERKRYALDPDNPWLRRLIDFTRAMVRFSAGRFPVALPQMRGPLDILAALRTPEQMCMDFVDERDEVHRIVEELADIWIATAKRVLAEIEPFRGGYCTRMKMWAPGLAITPQNDVSTLISPRMYQEIVFPSDQRIFRSFPYHSFHMHATEFCHVDTLLAAPELTAIQLTLEHTLGGPPLEKMLAVAERILARKPLILVPLDLESADVCLNRLPAPGLAVMVGVNSPAIPAEIDAWLRATIHRTCRAGCNT